MSTNATTANASISWDSTQTRRIADILIAAFVLTLFFLGVIIDVVNNPLKKSFRYRFTRTLNWIVLGWGKAIQTMTRYENHGSLIYAKHALKTCKHHAFNCYNILKIFFLRSCNDCWQHLFEFDAYSVLHCIQYWPLVRFMRHMVMISTANTFLQIFIFVFQHINAF